MLLANYFHGTLGNGEVEEEDVVELPPLPPPKRAPPKMLLLLPASALLLLLFPSTPLTIFPRVSSGEEDEAAAEKEPPGYNYRNILYTV